MQHYFTSFLLVNIKKLLSNKKVFIGDGEGQKGEGG